MEKPQRSQGTGTESGLQFGDVKLKVSVLIEELVQLTEDSIDACSIRNKHMAVHTVFSLEGLVGYCLDSRIRLKGQQHSASNHCYA